MKIRLIDRSEFIHASGAEQMALDDAIFKEYESCENPEFPVTLRFYSFRPAAVTFGYFQKNSTLNNDFIKKNNFETIRRITGGRAVLHYKDLTYSVIVHKSSGFYTDSILENYKYVADSILCGLSKLAITGELHPSVRNKNEYAEKPASAICFDSPSFLEIKVNNKKFCGSAQNKTATCFLQHGTIFFEFDPKLHFLCMTPPETLKYMDEEMIEDNSKKLRESVCSVDEIASAAGNGIDFSKMSEAICAGFAETFAMPVVKSGLSKSEEARLKELKDGKYMTPKWNILR
ncbi:MAG: hypothetical protein A2008_10690 [Candidatus Wallbacteria bacterium GWC2_49_35]|uniref:BPL/LPL catalytic domain-containing protein n=1 Tax=Candidatus Wallbacteria bacterium GWC2_49_35 TaxID=1817813 RepID=A0A1F7WTJ2_9BACT|nr:MAG: hypothetical protein A2008_10690 [Candidatus Wallbacteria bacterium GWC2_49_35]HBC76484.1 hypothetical protein [Candidatus Wallbacteria bacterium]